MSTHTEPNTEPKKISVAKNISFAAVFAALICVSTAFLAVPLPVSGYFNLGDAFVLLAGWLLNPIYAIAAAGLGSMLADVIAGAPVYALGTLIIKALVTFAAGGLFRALTAKLKRKKLFFLCAAIAATAGELIMTGGYFLYESAILGFGLGAAGNIPGNLLQGLCAVAVSAAAFSAIYPVKAVRAFFSALR